MNNDSKRLKTKLKFVGKQYNVLQSIKLSLEGHNWSITFVVVYRRHSHLLFNYSNCKGKASRNISYIKLRIFFLFFYCNNCDNRCNVCFCRRVLLIQYGTIDCNISSQIDHYLGSYCFVISYPELPTVPCYKRCVMCQRIYFVWSIQF